MAWKPSNAFTEKPPVRIACAQCRSVCGEIPGGLWRCGTCGYRQHADGTPATASDSTGRVEQRMEANKGASVLLPSPTTISKGTVEPVAIEPAEILPPPTPVTPAPAISGDDEFPLVPSPSRPLKRDKGGSGGNRQRTIMNPPEE